jgi:hypothetical protein
MIGQLQKSEADLHGEQVLQRIALLTLVFGLATAIVAMALHRVDWAKGLAGGAVLGWLNFRWLRRGIRAMLNAAMAQAEAPPTAPPDAAQPPAKSAKSGISTAGSYLALLFRYALVALGVYVIFNYLHAPLVSIGLGLCALIAAIMTASVWEVVKNVR